MTEVLLLVASTTRGPKKRPLLPFISIRDTPEAKWI